MLHENPQKLVANLTKVDDCMCAVVKVKNGCQISFS